MADEKETVIIDLKVVESGTTVPEATKEVNVLSTSILGLQKSNKALREERKLVDTSTAEGTKKIKELNTQIDKNDKAIKANSSSLEKQRLNVGNYTGALDKLIPGLGSTIDGMKGMTKASLQFIATPLGLILAAVALALGSIVAYFKGSEEGMDKFAKASAQVSAIINVLYDRVIALGGALVAFLSGDFEGGLSKIQGAFKGIGDEIQREVGIAGELAEALDKLEERELKYSVAVSEVANQIKQLILESKNRTLTEEQRIAKTKEAIDLEKKQNEERKKLNEEEIRIEATKLQQRFSSIAIGKVQGESEIDFAKRLIDNQRIVLADRQKLAELVTKYNEATGVSIGIQEKVQNQQDALNEKLQTRIDKENELIAKFDQEAKAFMYVTDSRIEELAEQDVAEMKAQSDKENRAEAQRKQNQEDSDFRRELVQAELNDTTKADAEKIRNAEKVSEMRRKKDEADAAFTADLLGEASALFRQNTIAYKVLASAQAAINAGVAISRAFAEYKYPVSLAVAALAAASAGAAIAKINDVQFAEGGEYAPSKYVSVGGRRHSQGGTKYRGEDGNGFEVEQGEGIYILKRNAEADKIGRLSALNMSHGGNSFANAGWYRAQGGAIETRSVAGANGLADIERVVRSVTANIPPPVVYVDDIAAKSQQVEQINKRARVVG